MKIPELNHWVLAQVLTWAAILTFFLFTIATFAMGLIPLNGISAPAYLLLSVLVGGILRHTALVRKLRRQLFSVRSAPGNKIMALSEFVFTKRYFETVVVPLIADMREEYFEALSQDRIWKARWVRIRGTYSFFAAIGLDRAFAFVSFFIKAWKSVN